MLDPYDLGYNYEHGIGVEKDEHKAFIHYQKSAEMGNANGIYELAKCYFYGRGVEKDEHKAFIHYQKSAEMGNSDAINDLGYCYQHGKGVEKDEHKAFVNYQKSADMGNASAIYNLADCYRNGIGIEKDEHMAFVTYQKSAEMGNSDAINGLGYCYRLGIGVEKDEHKAFINHQKSAEMGSASAIYNLANCYLNGIGVEKDEHKAFVNYQKSAEMGNIDATSQVGHCYLDGIGTEKDNYKAFLYYQKCAEMGGTNGMSQLGYCYRNGIGISRDSQKADYWYQMAKNKSIVVGEWTNENTDIDDGVKKFLIEGKYPLAWILYKEFTEIEKIGQGGFATVFYAKWPDYKQHIQRNVALKLLHGSNSCNSEFIKELKAYCDISSKHPSFLKCYGISKDDSGDYILVLEYASMGSLRQNLRSVSQMKWKDKLTLLHCIASDLQIIHSQELIHRDLHSGNILQDHLHSAYIADLGLSISTNIALNAERCGVYGILPYIAPEALERGYYSTASDIYSFAIIMWEILYGISVSYNQEFGERLQIEICSNDLRPTIIENMAQCYINLMKKCWGKDPEYRPSATNICEILTEWINDVNILLELTESDVLLKNVKNTHIQTYPDDLYRSKFIYYTASLTYQASGLNNLNIDEKYN